MADSDTPPLGDSPTFNQDRYTLAMAPSPLSIELVCRHCGAVVHMPTRGDQSPTTTDVHDAFHDRMDEMWVTHVAELVVRAERMERGDG